MSQFLLFNSIKAALSSRYSEDLIYYSPQFTGGRAVYDGFSALYPRLDASFFTSVTTTVDVSSAANYNTVFGSTVAPYMSVHQTSRTAGAITLTVSTAPTDAVYAAQLSPDGSKLFFAQGGGLGWAVAEWDGVSQYDIIDTIATATRPPEGCADWTPNNTTFAAGRQDNNIYIYRYSGTTRVQTASIGTGSTVLSVLWLNNNVLLYRNSDKIAMVYYDDVTGNVWDYSTTDVASAFTGISKLAASADGTLAFCARSTLPTLVLSIADTVITQEATMADSNYVACSGDGKVVINNGILYTVNPDYSTTAVSGWSSNGSTRAAFVPIDYTPVPTPLPTTWSPTTKSAAITLSGRNLVATHTVGSAHDAVIANVGKSSGKWYFEVLTSNTTDGAIGIARNTLNVDNYVGVASTEYSYYQTTGQKVNNGTTAAYGSSFTASTIGVAVDLDAGKIWFAKDNVWQASGDPAAGTNQAFSGITGTNYPAVSMFTGSATMTGRFKTGELLYAPPAGFSPWVT